VPAGPRCVLLGEWMVPVGPACDGTGALQIKIAQRRAESAVG
jgi:hypothetical protein